MSLQFVNINGEPVNTTARTATPAKSSKGAPGEYHKGWAVEGIPPGAREDAIEGHKRLVAMAENAGGKPIKPWSEEEWALKAKTQRVRSKPYEIHQAAIDCAALAEKAGWLRVRIKALSKGGAA